MRWNAGNILAIDAYLTLIGGAEACQDTQQCGLSTT